MLSEIQAQQIIEKALTKSPAEETECLLQSHSTALTRFANNTIHQNVSEIETTLSVRIVNNQKMGRFTTNKLDDHGIEMAVKAAMEISKVMPEQRDLLPMLGQQNYPQLNHYDESTARYTPRQRSEAIRSILDPMASFSVNAAGILETGERCLALGNSSGLFAYYKNSQVTFSLTIDNQGGSGYVLQKAPKIAELNLQNESREALNNALRSVSPSEISPGEYTVILTPQAVANLIPFLIFDYVTGVSNFSALGVDEKRSFLTGKLGKQIFGKNFTLLDDVYHPLQFGPPFDYEGVPKQRVVLVENGVPINLLYDRFTAKRHKTEPTGHGLPLPNTYGAFPANIVIQGENNSFDDLIKSTRKGLLVCRFWYIRLVDSAKIVLTGTTRDGTFLIENGEITKAVQNLRFNQSLLDMLNHIVAMTPSVRVTDDESEHVYVVPAMKVEKFHFSRTVTKS